MRLLIDTHVLIWWLSSSDRLDEEVAKAIEDPENEVIVSAASVWEIEIKRAKGLLVSPDDLVQQLDQQRLEVLAIDETHATDAARLPPHHSDPFDRMLVAQAAATDAVLVTSDPVIGRYGTATRFAG